MSIERVTLTFGMTDIVRRDCKLKRITISRVAYFGFIDINDANLLKSFSQVNNFLVTNNELGIRNEQFGFIFSEENLLNNSRMYRGDFNSMTDLHDNHD